MIETRDYDPVMVVTFRRTGDPFGGLSNMAPGFPLTIDGIALRTAEALYQACRFPHRPDVQRLILAQASPMTAKMRARPFVDDSRPDWDTVRVPIMKWCLRVKLLQHRAVFGALLQATGDRPIVEDSRRDRFWGAVRAADGRLHGCNVLGRLLMELRALLAGDQATTQAVDPVPIPLFDLLARPIGRLTDRGDAAGDSAIEPGGQAVPLLV